MGQQKQIAQHADRKAEKGFTLVELAIVMIIIGLLIGGVLKGQQLIENARVTATISQVKGFQAALNSFRDTYSATPGDMVNATTRLSGCTTGAPACANGNGNSLINAAAGGTNPGALTGGLSAAGSESFSVWKHLAYADLITGVDPTTVVTGWGVSNPSSSLRGGYELYYDTALADLNNSTASGHVLRMSNTGVAIAAAGAAPAAVGTAGASPASPLQAANIDRKLDDGRPGTGTVLSNAGGCVIAGPAYAEQSDQKNCVLYFLIDG